MYCKTPKISPFPPPPPPQPPRISEKPLNWCEKEIKDNKHKCSAL